MMSQYQPNVRYSPGTQAALMASGRLGSATTGTPSSTSALPPGANTSLPDQHLASTASSVQGAASGVAPASGQSHHHMHHDQIQQQQQQQQHVEGVQFESEVMVLTKQLDREEVTQPLQLTVSTGKGGPQGISRCVTVRITDPSNSFFLYVMELLEDEYGRFKEAHELNVDFAGFSRDLIQMLVTVMETPAFVVSFSVENESKGKLRILEKTGFRAVEHLRLTFLRQGDENQKRYLAERFAFFQNAFLQCVEEKRQNEDASAQLTQALRSDVEILTQERDHARQQLQLESSQSQSDKLGELATLKEAGLLAVEQLRLHNEAEMNSLRQASEAQVSEYKAKLQSKEDECAQTLKRLNQLDSDMSVLQERLTRTTDGEARKGLTIAESNKQIEELLDFQRRATQRITQFQLDEVAAVERVKHLTESNQTKEEELKTLREQSRQHDHYVRMLTDQTEAAQAKSKSLEVNLAKSHHIIKTMMSHQEVAKEKLAAAHTTLDAKEEALRERATKVDRLKAELASTQEKVSMLQGHSSQIKEQLIKVDEEKNQLQASLKQSEEAIMHMQRQTSSVGMRSYPMTSAGTFPTSPGAAGGGGGLGPNLTAPRGLHHEFARGQIDTYGSVGHAPAPTASSGLGLRQPNFLSQNLSSAQHSAVSHIGEGVVPVSTTTPTPSVVGASGVATPSTVGRHAVPASSMMGPTTGLAKPQGTSGIHDRQVAAAAESAYFPSA